MNKSATNFVELSTAGSINLHLPQILPMRRFSAPAGARYGKPAGIHIASAKKNLTDKTQSKPDAFTHPTRFQSKSQGSRAEARRLVMLRHREIQALQ